MKLALSLFMIISAGLSLMMSISEIVAAQRRPGSFSRCALFFCLALLQVQATLVLRNFLFEYPSLFFFHLTTLYLLGALLYFAHRPEVAAGAKPSPANILFFIPSLAALGFDVFYLVQPETNKLLLLGNFFFGGFLPFNAVITALVAGAGVQAALFLGTLLVMEVRYGKEGENQNRTRVRIILSMLMVDLLVAGYIIKFPATLIVISLVLAVVIMVVAVNRFFRKKKS